MEMSLLNVRAEVAARFSCRLEVTSLRRRQVYGQRGLQADAPCSCQEGSVWGGQRECSTMGWTVALDPKPKSRPKHFRAVAMSAYDQRVGERTEVMCGFATVGFRTREKPDMGVAQSAAAKCAIWSAYAFANDGLAVARAT
jgi:hypothetical protein